MIDIDAVQIGMVFCDPANGVWYKVNVELPRPPKYRRWLHCPDVSRWKCNPLGSDNHRLFCGRDADRLLPAAGTLVCHVDLSVLLGRSVRYTTAHGAFTGIATRLVFHEIEAPWDDRLVYPTALVVDGSHLQLAELIGIDLRE